MNRADCAIFSNRHFVVEQSLNCPIPGYLVVTAAKETDRLEDLDAAAVSALGPTLAVAVAAVRKVIRPVKIYCAQFGEETGRVHFHIFPRTREITGAYLRERPQERTLIHGPVLLDWVRAEYVGTPTAPETHDLIAEIRATAKGLLKELLPPAEC